MKSYKLLNINKIEGKLTLITGLHVGAGDMEMRIGGLDNAVIKHPFTLEPYIPGSSLKGKVRSLLEMRSGLMRETGGKPVDLDTIKKLTNEKEVEEGKKILRIFGTGGTDNKDLLELAKELGPTRVSFTDCFISKKWKEKEEGKDFPLVEVKAENSIDRITGTAQNPRFSERVPAGAEFDFAVYLKELEGDQELLKCLMKGLKLLSLDALGGSGSRGYGRIALSFDREDLQQLFDTIDPYSPCR